MKPLAITGTGILKPKQKIPTTEGINDTYMHKQAINPEGFPILDISGTFLLGVNEKGQKMFAPHPLPDSKQER